VPPNYRPPRFRFRAPDAPTFSAQMSRQNLFQSFRPCALSTASQGVLTFQLRVSRKQGPSFEERIVVGKPHARRSRSADNCRA